MSKKYTVDYFIKKFKAIPARLWITGGFHETETGACCALGHCGVRTSSGGSTPESKSLRNLFVNISCNVVGVNDFRSDKFPQTTPRGRILAALRYIKNKC